MVSYSTSDLKPGLKVLIDSEPCEIIEEEFVKPGKGQAFSKIKFRNLMVGKVGEKTCKIGETLDSADVTELNMQYLYSEGSNWYFMHPQTFDHILIKEEMLGINKNWITEEDNCKVLLWEDIPISVEPPPFVEIEISQTDPGIKGDTATGGSKPATLITGAVIKVPLFLSSGDLVTINTKNGEYQGRK